MSQKRSSSSAGFRLKTVDGDNAKEVLGRLFGWGYPAVRLLQGLACFQQWPGHEMAYLLNRWPFVRIP